MKKLSGKLVNYLLILAVAALIPILFRGNLIEIAAAEVTLLAVCAIPYLVKTDV